ncbi:MAG: hypothetical protein FJ276_37095, partial [Planctomycetes bacterium]|nr:hypothetical protein [Planctomycetota bacterium]
LWLTTVAADQPLNFLDHHLRVGNSLIGTRLEHLANVPDLKRKKGAELRLAWKLTDNLCAALHTAVGLVRRIEEAESASVNDVKAKEKAWLESIRPALHPFRVVANLWTACFFGNDLPQKDYEALLDLLDIHADRIRPWSSAVEFEAMVTEAIQKGSLTLAGREFDLNGLKHLCGFLYRSERTAGERRFFHWELEFPDVFFKEDGSPKATPGFDAVVGNPPYGALPDQETKTLLQRLFIATQYQPDLYVAFMERTLVLARQGGLVGLIVPTTFLAMHHFSGIRRYLLDHSCILRLIHFKYPVFAEPTVESAVYICQSEADPETRRDNTVAAAIMGDLAELLNRSFTMRQICQTSFAENAGYDFDLSLGSNEARLAHRLECGKVVLLGALAQMTVGLKPYQTGKGRPKQTRDVVQNRVFDAPYPKDSTYRRYLMGRDMDRYVVDPLEERWISYGEWLAEPRPEAPFSDPKRIVVRQTGDTIIAAIEDQQFLTLNNIHNLRLKAPVPAMEYLLALLNSKLVSFFHQQMVPEADRVFAEVKLVDLQQIPIRRIEPATPKAKRRRLFV